MSDCSAGLGGRETVASFLSVRPYMGIVSATALSLEGLVAVDADVARLRRGDLNALSELIARYQNRLYRYLLRIVRQPAEAEDLFQQTCSFDGEWLVGQ